MKLRSKHTNEISDAEAREDGIYLRNKYTNDWEKYSLDLIAKCYEYYVEPKEPLVEGRKQRAVLKAAARLSGATTARKSIYSEYGKETSFIFPIMYLQKMQ